MIYKVVDLETFEQSYSGTSLDAALEAWVSAEGEVVFVMYWDASVGGWRTFGEVPD